MGRRERRRRRGETLQEAPDDGCDSGLCEGQTQPEMREKLQRLAEGLRARRRMTDGTSR